MKLVILDGVGINLKTSIINEFESYGYPVLRSDSWFYATDDNRSAFPQMFKYSNRIQSRYLEICAAMESNQTDSPLIVDRGCFNQLIWGLLTYTEIVDDYQHDEDDYQVIKSNIEHYLSLENALKPHRVLLSTTWTKLLQDSLNEDEYYNDLHTQYRIDTYYDPDYYCVVRDNYEAYYSKYIKDYSKYEISNELGNSMSIPDIVSHIALSIENEIR